MARILVIEDEEQMRRLLRSALERSGHEVTEAQDGLAGVAAFRQSPTDLVISDILMPEQEGIQTIMELRRDFPEVKIIAISGGGSVGPQTYLAMARELGADATLTKPFSLTELSEAIESLLK
jgi:DNA-binding response OmpR family regulator